VKSKNKRDKRAAHETQRLSLRVETTVGETDMLAMPLLKYLPMARREKQPRDSTPLPLRLNSRRCASP